MVHCAPSCCQISIHFRTCYLIKYINCKDMKDFYTIDAVCREVRHPSARGSVRQLGFPQDLGAQTAQLYLQRAAKPPAKIRRFPLEASAIQTRRFALGQQARSDRRCSLGTQARKGGRLIGMSKILTVKKAATQFKTTRQQIRKMIANRELPAVKVGREWRIPLESIRLFWKENL